MADIEQIKAKIDIVDFISEHVKLKKAGRNFKACCPFHNEKTPSFVVSPERQTWHCFGACGTGGDVIEFLQKWENLEFLEALKILAQRAGVVLSGYAPTESVKIKERLYGINHLSSEFFHYLLIHHRSGSRAREYLKSRNIRDQTVKTFMLGYAPDSWDSLMRYLRKKGYTGEDIFTAGLSVKGDYGRDYDRFRGRLMFTLRDHRGNIVGFAGRKLPPQPEKEAKYVNTPETPVYIKGNTLYGLDINKDSIKKEKEAIIVEGEFDMLSSFQAGVTNVVAIKGSALTQGQITLLKRYSEKVALALDSDFAGNEAARRGIEVAENAGLSVNVIRLPEGKDPADCIGIGLHLWKKTVKDTVPVYDFVIDTACSKFNTQDITGIKKITAEVIPFLSRIENPIIVSHYIKYLAKKLAVTEESVELSVRNFQKKQQVVQTDKKVIPASSREVLLEEYFLSLILQSDKPERAWKKASGTISFDDLREPPVRKILEQLMTYLSTRKKFDARDFGILLSPEIAPLFDRAYLADINTILAQDLIFEKELDRVSKKIKKMSLRRRMNDITTIIGLEDNRTKEKDDEKLKNLNQQLRMLIEEIRKIDNSDKET